MNKEKSHRSNKLDWDRTTKYVIYTYAILMTGLIGYLIHSDAYHAGRMKGLKECVEIMTHNNK